MPFLGWKDRKTGIMYNMVRRCRDIDTKEILVILESQQSGQHYVIKNMFQIIEVDGEMTPRFCMWGKASSGNDDGF